MKIALIISVWKRHDLEKLVVDRFLSQSKKFGFEIVIAGSEGNKSKDLANGCHYIETVNFPVSNKHNAMLEKAKELNVDGVVLMGSDDMVCDNYWKFINTFTSKEIDVVGLKDLYFYSTLSKCLGYWSGFSNGKQTVGAGRFFSRYILDSMDWKLWNDGLNKGLDTNCTNRLLSKGISEKMFSMEESKVFLMDIKHTYSITNQAILNACKQVNIDIMAKKVSKKTADEVQSLDPIEAKPKQVEVEFFNGKREFLCNGSSPHLKKDLIVNVDHHTAQVFVNRGFGKLV